MRSILLRVAELLSRYTGSDARAEELRSHVSDSEAAGHRVTAADVGSIAILAGRSVAARLARDLPWWLAGVPVALLIVIAPVLAYETHFFAWDMIERPPEEASARFWKRAVDALLIVSFVAGLVAGRRCIEHLRHGRIVLPGMLLLATFVAASQVDLFVERTPRWRDGGLKESHINEVPMYSVALIAMFAVLPVLFVVIDVAMSRRHRPQGAHVAGEHVSHIDGRAIAAIVLPLFHLSVGPMWIVPFLLLTWITPAFSRRLKLVVTLALAVPVIGLVSWGVMNQGSRNDPLDDGMVIVLAVFASFLVAWLRMAFIALRPLKTMNVDVRFTERAIDSDAVS